MQNAHPKLSLIEHFQALPDSRVDRTKDRDLMDIADRSAWERLHTVGMVAALVETRQGQEAQLQGEAVQRRNGPRLAAPIPERSDAPARHSKEA